MGLLSLILGGGAASDAPAFYVVSFPKSGRTWLRVMLDDLGVAASYTHAGSDTKSFEPASALKVRPRKFQGRPVLLLVRDPRDVAVSVFFQVDRRNRRPVGPLSACIRSDHHGIEKIARFNLLWFEAARKFRRLAILRYEDLHAGVATSLQAITAYVGKPVDADSIAAVAERYTFANMQAQEISGGFAGRYRKSLQPADPNDPESFKVRKGKVGGYCEYLSADDVAYCDRTLAQIGYWAKLDAAIKAYGLLKGTVAPAGEVAGLSRAS
jgi:hypothetical protein